jgi:dTDP-4-dehydrorhamnose 3,5-epimerase
MEIQAFPIAGPKLIVPERFSDVRGYFEESWNDRRYREIVGELVFVQDNRSLSLKRGTVRGLHFQRLPHAQGKLVRVGHGSIFDVAVDIRRKSPTFGQHVAVTLDSAQGAQFWVPPGFLHAFCTLENNTEVFYKVTGYYSAAHDAGVIWNDPDLGIKWPIDVESAILSEKDQKLPRLSELTDLFQ